MSALSAASQVLARRLLAWDRARINAAVARGFDVTVYSRRQDLAEECIGADLDSWPDEVRELFQKVLEVTRSPTPARQHGIGPAKPVVAALSSSDVGAYKQFALELGVLEVLQEAYPKHWGDERVEA